MTPRPVVLILRALGLGDFLTGVPAYRALARAFPEHRIVLAAPAALRPLVDLVGSAISELHGAQPLQPLSVALHGAHVAINLHGRGPQSHRLLLAAAPRRLIAFAHDSVPEAAGGAAWQSAEHEVARWCRLLEHAAIPARPDELDLAVPPEPIPPECYGATLVHASAASESRRWPVDRWVAVARAERAAGRTVILTGDARDVARASTIAQRAGIPPGQVYAGRTSLRELAALVAGAGRVVCGDTGVAHLATAYRTPSVVLFGPVSPLEWGPPPERFLHRVLWAGRTGDPHAAHVDPGLLAISVGSVVAALAGLAEQARLPVSLPTRFPSSA